MAKFIKLHFLNSGRVMYLNINKIYDISVNNDGTCGICVDNYRYEVEESIDKVMTLIEEVSA